MSSIFSRPSFTGAEYQSHAAGFPLGRFKAQVVALLWTWPIGSMSSTVRYEAQLRVDGGSTFNAVVTYKQAFDMQCRMTLSDTVLHTYPPGTDRPPLVERRLIPLMIEAEVSSDGVLSWPLPPTTDFRGSSRSD